MKVVIFGGSGFIGRHLIAYFSAQQCQVVVVSRFRQPKVQAFVEQMTWDELEPKKSLLEGAAAFINLSGATINQYWTLKAKQEILKSRTETTKKIVELVMKLKEKPQLVINTSAVGGYGMSETVVFDEVSSLQGDDFLAHVVQEWEKAADRLVSHTRLIKLRLGVVLAHEGGAFPKMSLPFKWFLGGRLGSGTQWLSWIHIQDVLQLIDFCIHKREIHGPINATAPHPVTNDQFGRALAKELQRPYLFHVPRWMMKALLGEMSVMLLQGQKVLPNRLADHGFEFTYPTIHQALSDLVKIQ